MQYESFLFTRNQRRDFTAFVRPALMTNKEVSAIANAFNYVNDITPLTEDQPALYCFPLGEYVFLLRHYNSGRTHAGREIPVIEGVAVRREAVNDFAPLLPYFLAGQRDILSIAAQSGDVNTLEIQRPEPRDYIPEPEPDGDSTAEIDEADTVDDSSTELLDDLAQRYAADWLVVPFDDEGRALLVQAASDERLPLLHFAFGTNKEVVDQLRTSGVEFDIVGYLSTVTLEFRPRKVAKVSVAPVTSRARAYDVSIPEPEPVPLPPLAEPDFLDGLDPIRQERERRAETERRRGLLGRLIDILLGR